MKQITGMAFTLLLSGIVSCSSGPHITDMEKTMNSTGTFEVNLEFQASDQAPAGRMIIDKTYHGGIEGTGVGQMISKRTKTGPSVYFAIEEFLGSVDGKTGAFTLVHKGYMDSQSETLEVNILDGSGSGELVDITGSMRISVKGVDHSYKLEYKL